MRLGIVIPWRSQPTRVGAFHATVDSISKDFPDANIYFADKDIERFNVSASRNQGCRFAIKDDCDVLLVLDADTLVEKDAVDNSIRVAYDLGVVSLPFVTVSRLDDELSTSLLNEKISVEEIKRENLGVPSSAENGGAYILTPSTFLKLNGWDERFVGWGYEDNAFEAVHISLIGRGFHRSAGHAITLHHMDRDQVDMENNRDRYYSYLNKTPQEVLDMVSGNRVEFDING